MTEEELQPQAAAKGYKLIGASELVGSHRGYPYSAVWKKGGVRSLTIRMTLAKALKGQVIRSIRRALPKGCSVWMRQNQLTLTCGGREAQAKDLRGILETVTGSLIEENIGVPAICPLCREKDSPCDALALVGDGYVPVHQSCCRLRASENVTRAERNDVSGNYLTGIVGALLLGLAACLPTVLSIWFMDRIFAVLYALIPLGAYYGYKLFRGKMNQATLPIVIAVSVLALFAIEQMIFYLLIVDTYGVYPSVLDTVHAYFSVITPGDIVSQMAGSFLFLLLGLFLTFRVIKRTNQSEIQASGVQMESMIPYRGRNDGPEQ